jgi:hypothetical protein
LGTKADLDRTVSGDRIEAFRREHNLEFCHEVSAKTGEGVQMAFDDIAHCVLVNLLAGRYRQQYED